MVPGSSAAMTKPSGATMGRRGTPYSRFKFVDDVAHVAPARGAVVLERELEAWSAS